MEYFVHFSDFHHSILIQRHFHGPRYRNVEDILVVVLLLPFFAFLSPSFSHGFPLRGEGAEKGEVPLSDLSV